MPLVAYRATRIRAYVKSTLWNVSNIRARVRAFRNGVELSGSPRLANNIITIKTSGGSRSAINDSFWFYVPIDWRSGNVEFRVEIDSSNSVIESNESNNSSSKTVAFNSASSANVAMIPVHLHNNGNRNNPPLVYYISNPSFWPITNNLLRLHPISQLRVWYSNNPIYPATHGWPLYSEWDLRTVTGEGSMMLRLWLRNLLTEDPVSNLHYVGMVHPNINTTFTTEKGEIEKLGRASGIPGWQLWAKMTNDSGPIWYIKGGYAFAHELGHNKGLKHVKCGVNHPDMDYYPWPDPNCRLAEVSATGYYGFDVYSEFWGLNVSSIIVPKNSNNANPVFPLMGYRMPSWISPPEYCRLLPKYGVNCSLWTTENPEESLPNQDTLAKVQALQNATTYIAVSGLITTEVSISGNFGYIYKLDDPFADAVEQAIQKIEADATLPTQIYSETYTVVQLSQDDQILSSQEIVFGPSEEVTDTVHAFFELLPMIPDTSKVQIRQGDIVLDERVASPNAPVVTFTGPNGGNLEPGTTLTWYAGDIDDPPGTSLHFDILYSPNGVDLWQLWAMGVEGNEWTIPDDFSIPGSSQGYIRIMANDGFNTAQDDSGFSFTSANNPPLAFIQSPQEGNSFLSGTEIYLMGLATDIEDGPLSDLSLSWSSSQDGFLGNGEEVAAVLSDGFHLVTLTVTDSSGEMTQAQIGIWMGIMRTFLPVIQR